MICFVALLFTACVNNDSVTDKLLVAPAELEFGSDDASAQFVKVESNLAWKASTVSNWIIIAEIPDGFHVTVTKHAGTSDERSGFIAITSGNSPQATVTVTQLRAQTNPGGGGNSGSGGGSGGNSAMCSIIQTNYNDAKKNRDDAQKKYVEAIEKGSIYAPNYLVLVDMYNDMLARYEAMAKENGCTLVKGF